jgi:hypothetical protein
MCDIPHLGARTHEEDSARGPGRFEEDGQLRPETFPIETEKARPGES